MDNVKDDDESAYPAPTKCKYCLKKKPAEGWTICDTCYTEQAKIRLKERQRADGCSRFSDTTAYTTGQRNHRSRGSNGGRKGRVPEIAAMDERVEPCEHNARTQYHGDNYSDE